MKKQSKTRKRETDYFVPTTLSLKDGGMDFEKSVSKFVEEHSNLDLKAITSIDAGNIEGELLTCSEHIANISILLADAENAHTIVKQKVNECYAEVYTSLKDTMSEGGKKPTVEDLKNRVIKDDIYKDYLSQLNRCSLLVDYLKGVKVAVETKSWAVKDLHKVDKSRSDLL